jgi:hypothetical protein
LYFVVLRYMQCGGAGERSIRSNKRGGEVSTVKIVLAFSFWLANSFYASATDQELDRISIDGVSTFTIDHPMSPLLNSKGIKFKPSSTSNYSGYSAVWKIEDDILLLERLDLHQNKMPRELKPYAPSKGVSRPAVWYTGEIRIPQGDHLAFDLTFQPIFSKTLILEIEKGVVVTRHTTISTVTTVDEKSGGEGK